MKATRLRAAGACIAAALIIVTGALCLPTAAYADGADLKAALDDYAAGRNAEALEKLRAYVASNPDQAEIYNVIRDVEQSLLLNAMGKGDEHERLVKYLIRQAKPVSRARMNNVDDIRRTVDAAVSGEDYGTRKRAAAALRRAGDLAVPPLVEHLASEDAATAVNAMLALQQVHSDGTLALAEALQSDNARVRMYAASALGMVGDDRAVPALTAASQDKDENVAAKAQAALGNAGGSAGSVADAYVALGKRFYAEDPLTVRAFEDTMNVWRWSDGALTRVEVPAYLYGAQMAEECAVDALAAQPEHAGAAALLVRAILKQATDAEGMADHGGEKPESLNGARMVAKTMGYRAVDDALRGALNDSDWDVAVAACGVLADAYGDESLEGSAVSSALDSAEGRVRHAAAIAILNMSPTASFSNANRVATLAAQAASSNAIRQALVIDDNDATRSKAVMALEGAGYVVGGERQGAVGANRAKALPTLDVILIRANLGNNASTLDSQRLDSALMVIDELRADARTKSMRIVVLLDEGDEAGNAKAKELFESKYGDNVAGYVAGPLVDSVVVSEVGAAAEAGDLGPDRERANATAARAANAFANTDASTGVLDLASAVSALATAVADAPTDAIKMGAINALGNIRAGGGDALAKAISEGSSDEMKVAAAKALGNVLSVMQSDEAQVNALLEASKGDGDLASAALSALGKIRNLSPEQRLAVFNAHRLSVGNKAE